MSWNPNSIPYAFRHGVMIDADSLDHGGFQPDCLCPGCNSPLVAKIGRGIRVPHFAHPQTAAADCDFRTLSRRIGAHLLHRRITRLLNEAGKLTIRWRCQTCGRVHEKNVLEEVTDVSVVDGGGSSTSLTLFAAVKEGKLALVPIRRIDICAERVASVAAVDRERARDIPVWIISTQSSEDARLLEGDENLTAVVAIVVECQPPPANAPRTIMAERAPPPQFEAQGLDSASCQVCGKTLKKRFLYIFRWNPDTSEKVAVLRYGLKGLLTLGPVAFTETERRVAMEHGAATAKRSAAFYEYLSERLNEHIPVGSFSFGCDRCESTVETFE
jgi:hypothetical protein